jgi:hypothetical protein
MRILSIVLTLVVSIAATVAVYAYAHYVGYAPIILIALSCGALVAISVYRATAESKRSKRLGITFLAAAGAMSVDGFISLLVILNLIGE